MKSNYQTLLKTFISFSLLKYMLELHNERIDITLICNHTENGYDGINHINKE